VDEQSDPAELCLTVNEEPDAFVEKLRKIGPDIGFVALHPEMLFAMKKVKGDYHAARKVVESGHAD
jgi:predicted RNase H-like nuclease